MPIPKAGRLTYSCVRCANRKVKCDRQRPCSGCIKHQVDCVYNIAHSPRKKAKRIKVKALTDQLSHYQDLLQQHGIQPSQLAQSERQETSRASEELELGVAVGGGTDHEYFNKTQMIDGQVRFRFVEKYGQCSKSEFGADYYYSSLWTRVVEEVGAFSYLSGTAI